MTQTNKGKSFVEILITHSDIKIQKKEKSACLYSTGDIEDIPFKTKSKRRPT
jgi:hypothetical protein